MMASVVRNITAHTNRKALTDNGSPGANNDMFTATIIIIGPSSNFSKPNPRVRLMLGDATLAMIKEIAVTKDQKTAPLAPVTK